MGAPTFTSDAATAAPAERSAVVSKAVARATDLLGLSNAALARTIGVSEATASRLRAGRYTLDPGTKPYELALLLIRLFRSLDAVGGGEEAALRSWMAAANHALGGVPRELVQSVTGLVAAVDYVDAARARV
jgi:DNA-binding XRE family transcriptional regulator